MKSAHHTDCGIVCEKSITQKLTMEEQADPRIERDKGETA